MDSTVKHLKSAGLDGTRLIFRLSEMAAAANIKPRPQLRERAS